MISKYLVLLGSLGIILSMIALFLGNSDMMGYLLAFGIVFFIFGLAWKTYENKKYGPDTNRITGTVSRVFIVIAVLILMVIGYVFYIFSSINR